MRAGTHVCLARWLAEGQIMLQVLRLRKEGRSVRRRADQRQQKRAAAFRGLLEQLLETPTHDPQAVQRLFDQALQQA